MVPSVKKICLWGCLWGCLFVTPNVWAEAFQVIITETPMGAGHKQGVRRYIVQDSLGPVQQLTPLPGDLLYDPAGLALRNENDLFVGNRAAHTGNGTISRFTLYGSTFAFRETISGNQLTDCAQPCFDPNTGELFQTNYTGGVLSRFLFDAAGNPVANGVITMPDGGNQLGAIVRPADRQLFVSDYTRVRRFAAQPDGSYSFVGYFAQDGGALYHFMKIKDDLLYLTNFNANQVMRFTFDPLGTPVLKDTVAAENALDVDFSPDGKEMYVTDHRNGGIMRYRYDAETGTWLRHGEKIATPMLAGIVVTPTACSLPADLTGDCRVDLPDLFAFAGQWLVAGDDDYCLLSGNLAGEACWVDLADYVVFASQWLMDYTSQ
ncbi:MAG: hypothetical protein JW810_10955 [Sedimentisphaerales bacterium]|nr:hypothetical protein [Sedimentisphaerales bacterium]